ncbi:MAG: cytochrome c3 family protein [Emcibacteraceae bacterium]
MEWKNWNGSDHQKAMAVANDKSVLGKFDNVPVTIDGQENRFYKKDTEYWVHIDGEDHKIDYTFGTYPLQQYLIKMGGGKYQTLPLSWDSRPEGRGGQRWFHIYGDEHIPTNDRLHWIQPMQNWNGMCADCHSSGLKRGYDSEKNTFNTHFDKISVDCRSCHTPENDIMTSKTDGGWQLVEGAHTARWTGEKRDQREIEVCAACHSRRSPLSDGFSPTDRYLDSFSPTPVLMPEYFPDGQVRDEDYVWGSFLQSKMFAEGVICSDCHNPHSLKLKAEGNDMCTTCHQTDHFDTPDHHNHEMGSAGGQCVSCHMPTRTYMEVDARRDHSFRIPRPDLNHVTDAPDACTNCHTDQDAGWAVMQIKSWTGKNPLPHFGEVFSAVYQNAPEAEQILNIMIADETIPSIIRGSGYELLSRYPDENSFNTIGLAVTSDEPLIRLGAIKASAFIPTAERKALLLPLLKDEFKVIRIETVRALSDVDSSVFSTETKEIYDKAKAEFIAAENQVSWRGEGHFNLGLFYGGQNDLENEVKEYLKAMEIDPYFPASYVNLADRYRELGNEPKTIETIELGLSNLPEDAALNFSKGLYLIRAGKSSDALPYLKKATVNDPTNGKYSYVYSVAQKQLGQQN